MHDDTQTVDPRGTQSHIGPGQRQAPVLRILYHGRFDRIGAATLDGAILGGVPLPIGRKTPLFASADGVQAPLGDRCISRHQLTLTWRPAEGTFRITVPDGARRPVYVGPERRPPHPGDRFEPGTLIELSDRVLLWFDLVAPHTTRPMGMIGQSAAMWALRDRIRSLAPSASSVLVRGETGVGKELVVRALHGQSARHAGPLVAQNCGALPAHLVESELFGHVRGAFTGADRARAGLFEQAHGGTLFLDEIGELPPAVQATLLRVIQERTLRRVGGRTDITLDLCLAAATHRDLEAEVRAGRFRADLYARLERPAIDVPPLRDRREDIPLLLAAFLDDERNRRPHRTSLSTLWDPVDEWRKPLTCGYVRRLLDYDWPRNVRELRKLAEDIAIRLDDGARLTAGDAPGPSTPSRPATLPIPIEQATDGVATPSSPLPEWDPSSGPPPADTFEAVMRQHDYQPSHAARAFGVSRNTIYTWMKKHALPDSTDYGPIEIEQALTDAEGDIASAALALRISTRALKLRRTALERPKRKIRVRGKNTSTAE